MLENIKQFCEGNLTYIEMKSKADKLNAYDERIAQMSKYILNMLKGDIYPENVKPLPQLSNQDNEDYRLMTSTDILVYCGFENKRANTIALGKKLASWHYPSVSLKGKSHYKVKPEQLPKLKNALMSLGFNQKEEGL